MFNYREAILSTILFILMSSIAFQVQLKSLGFGLATCAMLVFAVMLQRYLTIADYK